MDRDTDTTGRNRNGAGRTTRNEKEAEYRTIETENKNAAYADYAYDVEDDTMMDEGMTTKEQSL